MSYGMNKFVSFISFFFFIGHLLFSFLVIWDEEVRFFYLLFTFTGPLVFSFLVKWGK